MPVSTTNVVNVSECDDIYLESASFNQGTSTLSLLLNDGNSISVLVPVNQINISEDAENQLVELVDGLFVPTPTLSIGGFALTPSDTLNFISGNSSITATVSKNTNNVNVDLSALSSDDVHNPLVIQPNQAFSFNPGDQILTLPLPTLVRDPVNPNLYTYTANDGTGTIYSIAFHEPLSVNFGVPANFNSLTQTLGIPSPSFSPSGNGGYIYNPGDGSPVTIIEPQDLDIDVCQELDNCTLDNLGNVQFASLAALDILVWDGNNWTNGKQTAGANTSLVKNSETAYTFSNGVTQTVITVFLSSLIDNEDGTYTFNDGKNNETDIVVGNTALYLNAEGFSYPETPISPSTNVTNAREGDVLREKYSNGFLSWIYQNGVWVLVYKEPLVSSLANVEAPFAIVNNGPQKRTVSQPSWANIYRTGSTGFGTDKDTTLKARVHIGSSVGLNIFAEGANKESVFWTDIDGNISNNYTPTTDRDYRGAAHVWFGADVVGTLDETLPPTCPVSHDVSARFTLKI